MLNAVTQVKIPPRMTPNLAMALAEALGKGTGSPALLTFMALFFLHSSWKFGEELPLAAYHELLKHLEKAGTTEVLLDILGDATQLPPKAIEHRVSRRLLINAQLKVMNWARELKTEDAMALRSRAEVRLVSSLVAGHRESSTLAEQLDYLIYTHALETRDSSDNEPAGGDNQAEPISDAARQQALRNLLPGKAMVMTPKGPMMFESHGEALQYVISQLLHGEQLDPDARASAPAVTEPASPTTTPEQEVPALQYAVFNPANAVKALQRMPQGGGLMGGGEGNGQQRRLLDIMANDTGLRELSQVPAGNPLAEMYERFPHFKAVLDFISKSLALAACGDEGAPVRIPAILLRGEPGTGKTYFAQELARVLGAYFVERDLSVTTEAFVISGMDSGWKNSKPGIVFDALVNAKTANPLILLNEVDKCSSGRGSHNSPIASLYALLEPTSAARFVDEFVPVDIDTSRVVWVLTANDGEIPEPILSRLEIFDIEPPTREQCRAIAISVWKSICERVMPRNHGFSLDMGEPILNMVSALSPRVMRKALTHAAASAALAGRKYLTIEDLSESQKRYQAEAKGTTMGFIG